MSRSKGRGSAAAGSGFAASGPTPAPWLDILKRALLAAGAFLAVLAAAAAVVSSWPGALSALFGGVLIILFLGISLLVGHLVGRSNPSGAMGMFVVTYAIKVVGFAVVLFLIGMPDWLQRAWFLTAAAGTVVVWQAAEIHAFSKVRFLLYADPDQPGDGDSRK